MAIATSEKIFIDPNEEIVTIIERIHRAEKTRVILVIPQNSLLLSSYISINILFREIAKTDKNVVIVTEDNYGQHIAEKAGFIVTGKVSTIGSEMWETAVHNKDELLARLSDRKQENLQTINESNILSENIDEPTEVSVDIKHVDSIESKQNDIEITPAETEFIETPDIIEVQKEIEANEKTERMLKSYQKPRREPRMVNIDGIEMLSGGDLKKFNEVGEARDKIVDENIMEVTNDTNTIEDDRNNITRKPIRTFSEKSSFTGMDFKKSASNGGLLARLFNRQPSVRRPLDEEFMSRKAEDNRKRLMIILGVFVVFFLLLTYFVAFRLSSVDITLTLKKEDVSTQGDITVDPTISTINTSTFTIPGQLLQENSITLSRTGEANGSGVSGNNAKGVIDILNTLDKDITLAKGTKITSTETNLVYLLSKDVTVNRATPAAEGSTVSGATRLEDVEIEAEAPGTTFNIVDSDSNKDFKIESYTLSQVKGSRYANISGGTSTEFVAVSQENLDKVKEAILPDLKKQAETKLNALVPSGFTLLKETVKFEETDVQPSPAVGAESKDKTFSLSLTGKISGLAIKKGDLESIAKIILINDRNSDIKINSINDLQIDKVQDIGGKSVLTISSKGSFSKELDDVEIKDKATGLSLEELREYLGLFDEIDKSKIVFSPAILPDFLKRVPTDFDRINLKIQ